MAKKRKKRTPEERAADDARHERIMNMLQERIDYWKAKADAAEQQQPG
jgi:hypothetical protein